MFNKFFLSRLESFNSRKLDRVSTGITALGIRIYGFQAKIMVGIAWSDLVRTNVATCINIFVPSAHSVGESPSRVPGQMRSPRELVKPTTRSNTDGRLSH